MQPAGKRRVLVPPELGYTQEGLLPQPPGFAARRQVRWLLQRLLRFALIVHYILVSSAWNVGKRLVFMRITLFFQLSAGTRIYRVACMRTNSSMPIFVVMPYSLSVSEFSTSVGR